MPLDLVCVLPTKCIVIPPLESLVIRMKAQYARDKQESNIWLLSDKSDVIPGITREQSQPNEWSRISYKGITLNKSASTYLAVES